MNKTFSDKQIAKSVCFKKSLSDFIRANAINSDFKIHNFEIFSFKFKLNKKLIRGILIWQSRVCKTWRSGMIVYWEKILKLVKSDGFND